MIVFLALTLFAFTIEQGTLIWAIIGSVFIIATFLYIIGHDILHARASKQRLKQLAHPCIIHFLIGDNKTRTLNYVVQDEQEHLVDTLVLPASSEVFIEFWVRPKLSFNESQWYWGFEGDIDRKPQIMNWQKQLVVRGMNQASPETNTNHWVDHFGYYHINGDRQRVPTEVYVEGFRVKTQEPGDYKVQVLFHGEEVLGKVELMARVQTLPSTSMNCIDGHVLRPSPIDKSTM